MDRNRTGDAPSPGKRALVVVNEQVAGGELRDALLAHLSAGACKVFVVAPALADSGLKHTMGDIDQEPPAGSARRN